MRHRLAALAIAAAALGGPAAGQGEVVRMTWRSSPDDPEEQTREVTRLYLALYNSGNLRVRTAANPDGLYPELFAQAEGALIGRGLTPALNAMLCDLNRPICRRERMEAAPEDLADLIRHVGGYEVTEPVWQFSPGAPIVLPDYRFEAYTTLRSVPVAGDWTPSAYVAEASVDCSRWGLDCDRLVTELNPSLLKQKSVAEVALPVSAFSTEVEIGYDGGSRYSEALKARALQRAPAALDGVPAYVDGWSPAFADFLERSKTTDLVLDALGSNVILVGDVKNFGLAEEPLFDRQRDLFKLIGHPFGNAMDLSAPYRHPVPILVLDSPFDDGRCDLLLTGEATEDVAGTCADVVQQPNPITDHAPHVLGLIGAPINQKGIVGINPFSRITFQPINDRFSAEADLVDAQIKLQSGALQGARVANLSWGFQKLQDHQEAFAFAVGAIDKKTLVVAAAGNQGKDLSEECVWIPACLHELPNVITVVGLDRNPDDPHLWTREGQGSNSNARFHIAAIAESVMSIVGHNKVGEMSGTSQAAPQVTAAASLIYSAAEDIYPELVAGGHRLAPKVVKDRLIYTTDLFRALQTKVLGGRLNVHRAIRVVDTQLVLKPESEDAEARHLTGSLIQFPEGHLFICLSPEGEQVPYHWSTIRRLSYDADRQRYVIFRHDAPPDDPANRNDFPLQRIIDCNMITLSNQAVLLTEDGEVPFQLREVLDYTSAMIE